MPSLSTALPCLFLTDQNLMLAGLLSSTRRRDDGRGWYFPRGSPRQEQPVLHPGWAAAPGGGAMGPRRAMPFVPVDTRRKCHRGNKHVANLTLMHGQGLASASRCMPGHANRSAGPTPTLCVRVGAYALGLRGGAIKAENLERVHVIKQRFEIVSMIGVEVGGD